MFKGLAILIKERFSLFSHIPMILCFTLGNVGLGQMLWNKNPNWGMVAIAFLIAFSFFLRLRLFDEIKDYETDIKVNPTRPLARGVLTIDQTKFFLAALILFELVLSGSLGLFVFVIHALAILYSLLMYEEFFIGKWIRPHLTIYGIPHTFVSCLIGVSVAFISFKVGLLELLKWKLIYVFLMNWAFFNLFEFARKTYAKSEEREGVATYSSQFGVWGAWGMSVSQALLGVGLVVFFSVYTSRKPFEGRMLLPLIPMLTYLIMSVLYPLKKDAKSADLFRKMTGLYLLIHYIICFVAYCVLNKVYQTNFPDFFPN